MIRNLMIAAIATFLAVTTVIAEDTRPRENDETISYLLTFVATSDCTFIRNGQAYNGRQASMHMQDKRRYFKNQIVTPEDFIRLAATKSLQTGQPYMVRTKDGQELRCDEWMKSILKGYRKTKKS
jgi:hypothetical protein